MAPNFQYVATNTPKTHLVENTYVHVGQSVTVSYTFAILYIIWNHSTLLLSDNLWRFMAISTFLGDCKLFELNQWSAYTNMKKPFKMIIYHSQNN